MTDKQSALDWAKEHGTHVMGGVDTDNYEPPRGFVYLDMWRYSYGTSTIQDAYLVEDGIDRVKDGHKAIYIINDGKANKPYYVAAWHDNHRYLILHPFSTDRGWQVGPQRAYHVILRVP